MEVDLMPCSLTECCFIVVAQNYEKLKTAARTLPLSLQYSAYQQLYHLGKFEDLAEAFEDLEIFSRILLLQNGTFDLHRCFQVLQDEGTEISERIAKNYCIEASHFNPGDIVKNERHSIIYHGLYIGDFLLEAGWNGDAASVFNACFDVCLQNDDFLRAFHCVTKLLHTYNANCVYTEAERMFSIAQEIFQSVHRLMPNVKINLSSLFVEYGAHHFAKCEYDKAYRWSIEALRMLREPGFVSGATLIDVLRLASRACVVKRQFKAAECLVHHAVTLARETYGPNHPKYSSTLLDFGFYLLNIDNVSQSLKVYQTALDIRQATFGGQNLHVAVAHEDLAYASYVFQYSTGNFDLANMHAEEAIRILSFILPGDHLLLASSNRVKALILEEIAIDSNDEIRQKELLEEAHQLHLKSLKLSINAFGEKSVQTAKHFGNLGRLYQSMTLYERAEQMHLKAIDIKEELLGPNDYEVALSIGHIASLYNYDMKQYEKAEKLYLRSIAITKQLYGEGYSGLEYDYRGLVKAYARLGDFEKMIEYDTILIQWHSIREQQISNAVDEWRYLIDENSDIKLRNTKTVLDEFFEKIRCVGVASMETSLEVNCQPSRDTQDIAFGGDLRENHHSQRIQSRGNDHRNVGDGTISHPPVSMCSTSTVYPRIGRETQPYLHDGFISEALKIFHVVPLQLKLNERTKIKKA